MHESSRGFRRAAGAAAMAVLAACAVPAGAGPALAAPGPPAWCAPGGTLQIRAMPAHIKIAECDLRGRTVHGANGLTAVVPSDGTSLVAHALRTTGGGAELRIEVDDRAGVITFGASGGRAPQDGPQHGPQDGPRDGPPASRAPAGEACRDRAYRLESSSWPRGSTITWRHHPGQRGLPMTGIVQGVANMAEARTDCTPEGRFTPAPNVTMRHAGRADGPPNVTGSAACGTRDQSNTFGWLAMTGAGRSVLAATCVWYRGKATVETDLALQEQGKRWWTGGSCPTGAYSAEAVATHEAGHVLGLGHVGGANRSHLTMAPSVPACDEGLATLGTGDYEGLIALYGAR